MVLYIEHHIEKERIDYKSFFRTAHIWRFGRGVNVEHDVLLYKLAGITPKYVEEYVRHLQGDTQ